MQPVIDLDDFEGVSGLARAPLMQPLAPIRETERVKKPGEGHEKERETTGASIAARSLTRLFFLDLDLKPHPKNFESGLRRRRRLRRLRGAPLLHPLRRWWTRALVLPRRRGRRQAAPAAAVGRRRPRRQGRRLLFGFAGLAVRRGGGREEQGEEVKEEEEDVRNTGKGKK